MTLWGSNTVAAASMPKNKDILGGPSAANGSALYANVTPNAFITGQTAGMFGANNTNANAHLFAHAGHTLVKYGTGPISGLTISAGGTGYSNTDLVKVSGGAVNAAATLVTNSTGGITSVTITTAGSGFINVASSVVAVTNSTGGGSAGTTANVVPVLGGRGGRVFYETLVAAGSFT